MPGNNLTLTNATFTTTQEKFGTAAISGGFGVTAGNINGSGPAFAWEGWARMSSIPGAIAVMFANSDIGYLGIAPSTGFVQGNANNGNTTINGSVNVCDGNYHHFAISGGETGFRIFVDGVIAATSEVVPTFNLTGSDFCVYCLQNSDDFPFTGGIIDEVAVWETDQYQANFTPPTQPYTGNEGMVALYHLDSNGTDSSTAQGVTIEANNAAFLYSPYNWEVTGSGASTINADAYFRILFTGNSLTLNFNVANDLTPLPEIYYQVDGFNVQSPWTEADVASTIVVTMPTDTAAFPWHILELRVKSTTQTQNRWNAPSNTAVTFTGLTLAAGGTVSAPIAKPKNAIFYGDSITEAIRTVSQTQSNDTDDCDNFMGWANYVADALCCEYGNIGFGGSGLTVVGSGNVPVLGTTFNKIMGSVNRTFTPNPDLIVINIGTNDSGAQASAVTAALVTVLQGLLAATPSSTPIAVLETFGGFQTAALQAAVTQVASSRVTFVSTAGFLNPAFGIDSLNLHPSGPNNLGLIGPQVAAALAPIMFPTGGGGIQDPWNHF